MFSKNRYSVAWSRADKRFFSACDMGCRPSLAQSAISQSSFQGQFRRDERRNHHCSLDYIVHRDEIVAENWIAILPIALDWADIPCHKPRKSVYPLCSTRPSTYSLKTWL